MTMSSKWILIFLFLIACFLTTNARRGGGGSRGSSSRGSSSRGSSSSSSRGSSSSSRGTDYGRDRSRSRPAEVPRYEPPKVQPKPSAPKQPEAPRQPASNPNFRDTNPASNQKPPPYSPRERPPPYSPNAPGQQGAPPAYNPSAGQPGFRQPNPGEAPPPYSAGGGISNANYPRQPGILPSNTQQGGIPGANYPRQPGVAGGNYPQQGGVPGANYPRQPGVAGGNIPQQGGVSGASYPRQPGVAGGNFPQQGGVPGANYPRQPGVAGGNFPQQGGISGANYPRQPGSYPAQTLGSNVWHAQSGRPAPAYMNYGGLPTGTNMNSKSYKKQGFLGSLMSMGSHKSSKNKYYGSQPSPFGMGSRYGGGGMMAGGAMGGMMAGGAMGGFLGSRGSKAAMYTILPYMAMRSAPRFMPRFGFMPLFLPSPFHHHHYGYGYGHGYGHGYGYDGYRGTHYDVYNNDYVGRCNRPLAPDNGKVMCNSTNREVDCDATCEEGYRYDDNTTTKSNKCWHVTGVWRPTKNFPGCKPVCNETCLNGGTCIRPGVCGCASEYRGPRCELHILKCDVLKLAKNVRIRWVCRHSTNGTSCKIKCQRPYEFESPPAEEYTCTPNGIWTPDTLPQCVNPDTAPVNATSEIPKTEAEKLSFQTTEAPN